MYQPFLIISGKTSPTIQNRNRRRTLGASNAHPSARRCPRRDSWRRWKARADPTRKGRRPTSAGLDSNCCFSYWKREVLLMFVGHFGICLGMFGRFGSLLVCWFWVNCWSDCLFGVTFDRLQNCLEFEWFTLNIWISLAELFGIRMIYTQHLDLAGLMRISCWIILDIFGSFWSLTKQQIHANPFPVAMGDFQMSDPNMVKNTLRFMVFENLLPSTAPF